jgi:muramidase (phage lysozyme)
MSKGYSLGKFLTHATILLWLMFAVQSLRGKDFTQQVAQFNGGDAPLVMQGGDPYIRALMRTISMSESNYPNPYAIIHGGSYTDDLSQHPDRCTNISVGPNAGRCSTAAGRYQFLTTTWSEKARIYHPYPARFIVWERYSFEPKYQDAVMYAWLTDPEAWGGDLRTSLQQGYVQTLQHLDQSRLRHRNQLNERQPPRSLQQVPQRRTHRRRQNPHQRHPAKQSTRCAETLDRSSQSDRVSRSRR